MNQRQELNDFEIFFRGLYGPLSSPGTDDVNLHK